MRESVYALGDVSRYHTEFINQACPNIKVIGRAYLVGPDNVAHWKNHIAMDVVPAGTKIQGKTVDPKYLPQDNIENLKVLYSSVIGYQNFTWINGAYLESETANLQVVVYDKYTVTFWSNGYKSFTGAPVMCAQYLLQASHPPGFYRTSRNNVWIDLDKEYNRIPEGTNITYVAEGKVTCGFIGISPIPGTADSGDVYRVGVNQKIYIVTTRRLYSNTQMRATLDVATDPWGIKVNRVELKNIIPPAAIQDAMEKQMKAERERREAILIAEGEKKSAILHAEGQKESMVLQAEGDKEAAILRAEAKKEATIREAEGQAEAIRAIQKANAQGIESIKAAKADNAVIQLKSLEAFAKAADGKATKIIIPSEIQGMAGLVKSITEVAKDDEKNIADLIEEQVQDTVKEQ